MYVCLDSRRDEHIYCKFKIQSAYTVNIMRPPQLTTVPGSIACGVTGFFSDIFPSDRTMARGSTQPLVKMSTRNIPGGKGGRCVRLTTSPPSCAEWHENLGAQTSCNPLGHTGPVTGWLYLYQNSLHVAAVHCRHMSAHLKFQFMTAV